jgi:hypothetical protein
MTKMQFVEQAIARIEETATDRQKEATKLLVEALSGDVSAKIHLMEGISTSDIPTLLTPAINVTFLAKYAAQQTVWNQIAEEYTVPSFGEIKFGDFNIDPASLISNAGDDFVAGGLPVVGEYDEYPAVNFTTTTLNKSIDKKRGVRARLSWEALRKVGNFDILGKFTDAFATYAAKQEDIALAKLFVTTAGAAGADWAGKGLAGNPALTADGFGALGDALAASRAQTVDGVPVSASTYKLVYGAALAPAVDKILSISNLVVTDANGTYDVNASLTTGKFRPIEFNTMDLVSGGDTDAFWFVIPEGQARPQFLEVFLEGMRAPMISVKDSGHFSLAGGQVPVREGSFDEDDIQTRVRHVVDAVAVDLTGSVYSTGAGV